MNKKMKKFIIFILSLFFLFSGLNWENLVQVQVVDGVAKEYLDKEYIVKINFLNVLAGMDDDEGHDDEGVIIVDPTNPSPIQNPLRYNTFGELINAIVDFIFNVFF